MIDYMKKKYFKSNFHYFRFYNKNKELIKVIKIYYTKPKHNSLKSKICLLYDKVI